MIVHELSHSFAADAHFSIAIVIVSIPFLHPFLATALDKKGIFAPALLHPYASHWHDHSRPDAFAAA